ncbi:MAG: LysE family transporter [Pseudomonadota bacterium]
MSLIVAIGAQNAFLLRQALGGGHVAPLVGFCALSDAFLIVIGVAGVGALFAPGSTPMYVLGAAAIIVLLVYAGFSARRALRPRGLEADDGGTLPLGKALAVCAAFTWANPHVYLDTVALIGGLSAPYVGLERWAYGAGAVTASFVWFSTLGFGGRALAPRLRSPMVWRYIDLTIAAILTTLAISLAVSLL